MTYKKIILIFSGVGVLFEIIEIIMAGEEKFYGLGYFCCGNIRYNDITEIILFPVLHFGRKITFDLVDYIGGPARVAE
jgi:hypothetical protein